MPAWITAKCYGKCKECGARIFVEDRAVIDNKDLYCEDCGVEVAGPDQGERK